VCPDIDPPLEPCFYAFSFTAADADGAPGFVIAGSAETREGSGSYSERTIRRGETSPEAMREKARYVLGEMERRLAVLGLGWADHTGPRVYLARVLYPFPAAEIGRGGAGRAGLPGHYARPPVQELEFEMDCRSVSRESVV